MKISSLLASLFLIKLCKKFCTKFNLKNYTLSHGGIKLWKDFLDLQSYSKKVLKASLDFEFLKKCLDYKVIPTFINFKLWNPAFKKLTVYY